ncbi:MAG: hypothetical protein MUF50_02925 [Planctomycetes bacterium]|jgi:hypothetical protein|nr:hypothetical protein [Planctomycetota bacterium]
MSYHRWLKILGLLLYVALALITVYFIQPSYFISIIIVLGIPAIINWSWLKHSKIKVLIFALLTTLLFAPPVELMARLKDAWDVASIFPRPFGYIPLENILFAFLNFFWVLSFYEYFCDRSHKKTFSSNFKYLTLLYLVLNISIFSLFFYNKNLIGFDYYSLAIPILLIPAIIIFSFFPKLLVKTIYPTVFFALVFFAYEIISLNLGHWWWPGHYLFPININDKVFPLDDVIIWYFLSTPTLIGGYEIFIDNKK